MNRKWQWALLVAAGAAIWLLPDLVQFLDRRPDEAWARIQQSGVIRFAINPTYMPFDGLGSQGDFFGIDVDLANELARRLGARAEFVIAGDSLYDVLRVGQAEATISALPMDPAKLGLWAYSEPYFEAGQVMVANPARVSKLSPGSIAVEYGSDADAAARYLVRRRVGVEIKYTQSAAEALKAVANGWTDAAIVDGASARQLLPRFPDLQVVEQLTHNPYAIAVRGKSTQLLAAINTALDTMKRDGTIERMTVDWMKR